MFEVMMPDKSLAFDAFFSALERLPRAHLGHLPTPVEPLTRLGEHLGIELLAKRDDLTGLAGGGNKIRQLEFYMGPAVAAGADTVLVTGAVQSNFVRSTVAAARKLGMDAHVQLEERVPDADPLYRRSGNVLLDQLMGATIYEFPEGEDEAAADAALDGHADRLREQGRNPYVIHLGVDHPPLGALGYAAAAAEVASGMSPRPDVVVIPSGSSLTHAGFLAGARCLGWDVPVIGICVRRTADLQFQRVLRRARQTVEMLGLPTEISEGDVVVSDAVFAPGYGRMNEAVASAIDLAARKEALLLDPVYTGRAMAGLIAEIGSGQIAAGSRVLFLHTGGGPAMFAYQNKLADWLGHVAPVG